MGRVEGGASFLETAERAFDGLNRELQFVGDICRPDRLGICEQKIKNLLFFGIAFNFFGFPKPFPLAGVLVKGQRKIAILDDISAGHAEGAGFLAALALKDHQRVCGADDTG